MSIDLKQKWPLPCGENGEPVVQDAVVNRSQLAKALGVSENTISSWLSFDDPLPCLSQGTNGKGYEFQLSDCYAWRMEYDARVARKKADGDNAAQQLSLLFRNDVDENTGETAAFKTADLVKSESEAEYKRMQAAQLRKELVRASQVSEVIEDGLVEIRTAFVTLVDYCEIEFGLEVDQVAKLEARCNGSIIKLKNSLGEVLGSGPPVEVPLR